MQGGETRGEEKRSGWTSGMTAGDRHGTEEGSARVEAWAIAIEENKRRNGLLAKGNVEGGQAANGAQLEEGRDEAKNHKPDARADEHFGDDATRLARCAGGRSCFHAGGRCLSTGADYSGLLQGPCRCRGMMRGSWTSTARSRRPTATRSGMLLHQGDELARPRGWARMETSSKPEGRSNV
jgi:hypothetical protein